MCYQMPFMQGLEMRARCALESRDLARNRQHRQRLNSNKTQMNVKKPNGNSAEQDPIALPNESRKTSNSIILSGLIRCAR